MYQDAVIHGIPMVRGALGGNLEENMRKTGGNVSEYLKIRLSHTPSQTGAEPPDRSRQDGGTLEAHLPQTPEWKIVFLCDRTIGNPMTVAMYRICIH